MPRRISDPWALLYGSGAACSSSRLQLRHVGANNRQRRAPSTRSAQPPSRETLTRNIPLGSCTTTVLTCQKTRQKPCAGTGWPPSKAMPTRSTSSGLGMPGARVFGRRRRSRALVPDGRRARPCRRAVLPRGQVCPGRGCLEDDAEAVLWYRLAAEGGHAEAQYFLGNIYDPDCQSGVADGVDVWLYCTGLVEVGLDDIVLAHMWYNIAGANGHDQARRRRDSLEGEMTRAEINLASELARACMASDYEDCDR